MSSRDNTQLNATSGIAKISSHQAYVQRVLSITAAALSIASGVLLLLWWYALPWYRNWAYHRTLRKYEQSQDSQANYIKPPKKRIRQFRHDLTMALIVLDLIKAIVLITYPIRYLHDEVYLEVPHLVFCDVIGFFTTASIQASDFAVLALAIHTALLVFKPHFKGGLYRFRYIIYTLFFFLIPIVFASIGMVGNSGYTAFTAWCYLVVDPVWYSLVLAWIPRMLIMVLIIIIYFSIFLYVKIHLYNVSKSIQEASHVSWGSVSSASSSEKGKKKLIIKNKNIVKRAYIELKVLVSYMPGFSYLNPYLEDENKHIHSSKKQEKLQKESSNQATSHGELTQVSQAAQDLSKSIQEQLNRGNVEKFNRRRHIIERQVNSIFIYPITYVLLYIFPLIQQILYYKRQAQSPDMFTNTEPIYWLALVASWMKPFNCFVDTTVFVIREGILPFSSKARARRKARRRRKRIRQRRNQRHEQDHHYAPDRANPDKVESEKAIMTPRTKNQKPANKYANHHPNRNEHPISPPPSFSNDMPGINLSVPFPHQQNSFTQTSVASTLLNPDSSNPSPTNFLQVPDATTNNNSFEHLGSNSISNIDSESTLPAGSQLSQEASVHNNATDIDLEMNGNSQFSDGQEDEDDQEDEEEYLGDYDIDYVIDESQANQRALYVPPAGKFASTINTDDQSPGTLSKSLYLFLKWASSPLWHTTDTSECKQPDIFKRDYNGKSKSTSRNRFNHDAPRGSYPSYIRGSDVSNGHVCNTPISHYNATNQSSPQLVVSSSRPPEGFKHWNSFSFQGGSSSSTSNQQKSYQGNSQKIDYLSHSRMIPLKHLETIQSVSPSERSSNINSGINTERQSNSEPGSVPVPNAMESLFNNKKIDRLFSSTSASANPDSEYEEDPEAFANNNSEVFRKPSQSSSTVSPLRRDTEVSVNTTQSTQYDSVGNRISIPPAAVISSDRKSQTESYQLTANNSKSGALNRPQSVSSTASKTSLLRHNSLFVNNRRYSQTPSINTDILQSSTSPTSPISPSTKIANPNFIPAPLAKAKTAFSLSHHREKNASTSSGSSNTPNKHSLDLSSKPASPTNTNHIIDNNNNNNNNNNSQDLATELAPAAHRFFSKRNSQSRASTLPSTFEIPVFRAARHFSHFISSKTISSVENYDKIYGNSNSLGPADDEDYYDDEEEDVDSDDEYDHGKHRLKHLHLPKKLYHHHHLHHHNHHHNCKHKEKKHQDDDNSSLHVIKSQQTVTGGSPLVKSKSAASSIQTTTTGANRLKRSVTISGTFPNDSNNTSSSSKSPKPNQDSSNTNNNNTTNTNTTTTTTAINHPYDDDVTNLSSPWEFTSNLDANRHHHQPNNSFSGQSRNSNDNNYHYNHNNHRASMSPKAQNNNNNDDDQHLNSDEEIDFLDFLRNG